MSFSPLSGLNFGLLCRFLAHIMPPWKTYGVFPIFKDSIFKYVEFLPCYIRNIKEAFLSVHTDKRTARSRYARPLIWLRDVPMELSRLRSARSVGTVNCKNSNFRSQPTAAHLGAR